MFKNLEELIKIIRQRKESSLEASYTKKLLGDKKWKYELDNDYYNNPNHSATPVTQNKTVVKR